MQYILQTPSRGPPPVSIRVFVKVSKGDWGALRYILQGIEHCRIAGNCLSCGQQKARTFAGPFATGALGFS